MREAMKSIFYYIAGIFSIWLVYCAGDIFFERKENEIVEARIAANSFVQDCENTDGKIAVVSDDVACVREGRQLEFFSFKYEPDYYFIEAVMNKVTFGLLQRVYDAEI